MNIKKLAWCQNETIVIDYSSPNIAKSFSVGHLRSTMIGHALKNIYEKAGYHVVGVNHLGDWGTQFGKMIVAYNRLNEPLDLSVDPIKKLQDLSLSGTLSDLPKSFAQLSALTSLNLNDNSFVKLPQSVCELSNLQELNLSNKPVLVSVSIL
mgnify:CR=1 FL=1